MGSLMERTQPISRHMAEISAPIISTVTVVIAQTLLSSQGPAQRLARRKQRAADPRAVSRTQSSCDGEGGWSTFLSPKKGWLSALKAPSVQLERWPRLFLGTCRSLLAALATSNPATRPPPVHSPRASRGTLRKTDEILPRTSCTPFHSSPGLLG